MKKTNYSSIAAILIAGALLAAKQTQAQIIISEVDPNGSGTGSSSYNQDWFELENLGSSAVDITGWKMDDSSDTFSLAVGLRGITSIAAGQAVVFIEDGTDTTKDAALDAAFASAWFGSDVPSTLTLANYGGSGVGLSSTADAVNIFDANGNAVTGVSFGATTLGATLDNTAGLSGLISQLSVVGVNGAFSDGAETGSPGNVSPTPEPSSIALAGVGAIAGLLALRRSRKA